MIHNKRTRKKQTFESVPYNDRYAQCIKEYEDAYQTEAVKQWIASLSHDQRENAEKQGLLKPYCDDGQCPDALPELPPEAEPIVEFVYRGDDANEEEPARTETIFDPFSMTPEHRFLFLKALREGNHPEITWCCMCYIVEQKPLEVCARTLGSSVQAFHYHVCKFRERYGLRPTGNQLSEQSRTAYRYANSRRG